MESRAGVVVGDAAWQGLCPKVKWRVIELERCQTTLRSVLRSKGVYTGSGEVGNSFCRLITFQLYC